MSLLKHDRMLIGALLVTPAALRRLRNCRVLTTGIIIFHPPTHKAAGFKHVTKQRRLIGVKSVEKAGLLTTAEIESLIF